MLTPSEEREIEREERASLASELAESSVGACRADHAACRVPPQPHALSIRCEKSRKERKSASRWSGTSNSSKLTNIQS